MAGGAVKGFLFRVLVSMDQALNVLTGGDPDETLSSRWGRNREMGGKVAKAVAKVGCKVLDALEEDHCKNAVEFTTTGDPDAHHLSRPIREIPRGGKSGEVEG